MESCGEQGEESGRRGRDAVVGVMRISMSSYWVLGSFHAWLFVFVYGNVYTPGSVCMCVCVGVCVCMCGRVCVYVCVGVSTKSFSWYEYLVLESQIPVCMMNSDLYNPVRPPLCAPPLQENTTTSSTTNTSTATTTTTTNATSTNTAATAATIYFYYYECYKY